MFIWLLRELQVLNLFSSFTTISYSLKTVRNEFHLDNLTYWSIYTLDSQPKVRKYLHWAYGLGEVLTHFYSFNQ